MPDSRLLYKAASKGKFFLYLVCRAGIILICIVAGQYFNDNPVGISIVFGIGLLFFLGVGDDEIHLYSDKIVVRSNALLFIMLKKRSLSYNISEIKSAYIDDGTPDELTGKVFISIISFLYSKSPKNKPRIYLELKNGYTKRINAELDRGDVQLLVNKINALIQ